MKKKLIFINVLSFLLIFLLFSCDPETGKPDNGGTETGQPGHPDGTNPGTDDSENPDPSKPIEYPQVDTQAIDLDAIAVTEERLFKILQTIDPAVDAVKLYKTNITEDQINSIRIDIQKEILTGNEATDSEKYEKLFQWVTSNIKYGETYDDGTAVNNDPFEVYVKKKAICQGYSNLLKVMCLTQEIPVVSANGFANMGGYMGHAWLYVYVDGQWKCSDPTNAATYDLKTDSLTDTFRPTSVELDLFEDDNFCYEYVDSHINVAKVKKSDKILTVPYSAGGFVINAFSPQTALPAGIEEIVLGKNISSLSNGEETGGTLGLETNGKQVVKIHVDPENPKLESWEGVIYKKGSSVPYFIPHQMTVLTLKPGQKTYGKDAGIKDRNNITEIVFPDDTAIIESWTVERCSDLKQVSVPQGARVDKDAFPTGVQVMIREESGQV